MNYLPVVITFISINLLLVVVQKLHIETDTLKT